IEFDESARRAYEEYEKRIEAGMAMELARANLPMSMYTEAIWKIDLRNLFNFLMLRLDGHAQLEIRDYAKEMAKIAKAVAPIAYEAFEDYVLNAVSFSKQELEALGLILKHSADIHTCESKLSKRELKQF